MANQFLLRTIATVLIGWTLASWPAGAFAQTDAVKMEWLSWSMFRFTSPTGKVIVTNPFVTNPDSQVKVTDFPKVDVILVPTGHRDEVGATAEIALKTGAKIVSTWEMWFTYFKPRKVPVAQMLRSNPGYRNTIDGITIRNVNAVHGSGTGGGTAMGFMITFENGLTVYFSGSTTLTMDMQLWGRLYKPDVAILDLTSGHDPRDIVEMVRLLRTGNPNLKTIIPHHHRLKLRPGAATPADLESALKAAGLPVTLLNPELGKVYELTK